MIHHHRIIIADLFSRHRLLCSHNLQPSTSETLSTQPSNPTTKLQPFTNKETIII